MAARRLLIVMLVLLGVSSVIAVIVPEPSRDDSAPGEKTSNGNGATGETGSTGETGKEGSEEQPAATGEARQASVTMGEKRSEEVKAKSGTRLVLTVNSKQPSVVEIDGLGLTGFADRFAPAVFDLILPGEPGRYEIRTPGEEPVAVIVAGS